MTGTPFLKMHGLGNDFVVLDARSGAFELTAKRRRAIADRGWASAATTDRARGADRGDADVFMRIYNPDAARPVPAATPRAASLRS